MMMMNASPLKPLASNSDASTSASLKQPSLSGPLEFQKGPSWIPLTASLLPTKIRLEASDGSRSECVFGPETRVQIPMRNMREAACFKGCAFQVETASHMYTFCCASLKEKNDWARAINSALAQLKTSQLYELPLQPQQEEQDENATSEDNFFVRQAQSVKPQRSASRTPQVHFSTPQRAARPEPAAADRSVHIAQLQERLDAKQLELQEMEARLRKEEAYREQITAGVTKWREDFTRNREQKLQDTQERLKEETEANVLLRKKTQTMQERLEMQTPRLEELERELESFGSLQQEVEELRAKLEKEVAFSAVLEQDSRALSERLQQVIGSNETLQEELTERDRENLELREEVGKLTIQNRRLEEQQNRMLREFFFSMAISIKLSLAQQGIYSNANLNVLYEQVLAIDYREWHDWIRVELANSQLGPAPQSAPAATPSKKSFFGSLFNK